MAGWNVEISFILFGQFVGISFYPLGKWLRAICSVGKMLGGSGTHCHLILGPLHAWTYPLAPLSARLAIEIEFGSDPFWGGNISAPPSDRVLFQFATTPQGKGQ